MEIDFSTFLHPGFCGNRCNELRLMDNDMYISYSFLIFLIKCNLYKERTHVAVVDGEISRSNNIVIAIFSQFTIIMKYSENISSLRQNYLYYYIYRFICHYQILLYSLTVGNLFVFFQLIFGKSS